MKVKVVDDCCSAADALARAAAVRARIKQQRAAPPRVASAAVPAQPYLRASSHFLGFRGGGPLDAVLWAIQPYILAAPRQPGGRPPRIVDVRKAVADISGVAEIEIISRRRTAAVVAPRQLSMALSRRLTLRSLPEIGRMHGGRDHTTVIHAVAKYGPLLDQVGERIGTGASLAEWVAAGWEAVANYKKAPRTAQPQQVAA